MRIFFHRTFKKKYKKAPISVRRQTDERLRLFARAPLDPALNNHPLSGDRKGEWSINVTGNWRAIYVHEDPVIVQFTDLDTHSNLYK